MPQTPIRPRTSSQKTNLRPGQDMVMVKQQAGKFPSIGMALPNYQYDPRDQYKRTDQTVVKRGGWFKKLFGGITLKRTVITLVILMLICGGWLGYKFLNNAHKVFGGNILSVLKTTRLKGENEGRVNILLAGNSADDPGHNGAELTDSIMLMSVDTRNKSAYLISIPRDLWIKIDDYGHQKINEAYVTGKENEFKQSGFAKGGMGQLEQVVSDSFGVPIHYYALVDYNALKQGVDALGGIDYTVKSSDSRGLYDPNIDWTTKGPLVKLTNGPHHLTGQQALNLSRARGDAYNSYGFAASDFDRTAHQREILIAAKSKAVSASVITNPAKLSSLSDVIGNNVKTDLKLNEVRRLYDLTKDIPSSNIKSLSLNKADGKNLLTSYATPQGQSALIPAAGLDNFSAIQAFIRRQNSNNQVVQESATIVILNSTTTNGLATKVKKKLVAQNLIIDAIGDAKTPLATTSIIDSSTGRKPATSALLVKQFGNHLTKTNPFSAIYDADFIIVLGNDQALKD